MITRLRIRRRAAADSAIHEHLHFHAAVLGTAGRGLVGADRVGLTEARRIQNPARGNVRAGMPAAVAISAATTFERMPPDPSGDVDTPIDSSSS